MPELITIEEAARITGFPSEDIQYWAKSHKITSGTKMQDVAKRCDISYDRLCYRYKNIVLRLQESTGFLAEYKKTIKYQDLEIERLRLENRNMEYELKSLYKKALESGLYIESPRSLVSIPQSAAKRICQPITNLTLSPYDPPPRRCH